jgi:DNA-binding GntR family transcriptional regulator
MDEEHQQIYDCIVLRDVKKARTILARHISSVRSQVLASVRQILAERERPDI